MNAHQVPTQVMLATEGSATRGVGANMGLQAIGIVGGHVRLQVISASES